MEVAAAAPSLLPVVAGPVGVMMGASALAAALAWLQARRESTDLPPQGNPTELKAAIVFAGLFAGMTLLLAAAQRYVGPRALFGIAALSGLTDMDAITLATANMAQDGSDQGGIDPDLAWRLIVIAAMANQCFKGLIAATLGGRALARRVALGLAVPIATGAALLVLWNRELGSR
jgi:uncharacterized membrane protein (DUF4010 family)